MSLKEMKMELKEKYERLRKGSSNPEGWLKKPEWVSEEIWRRWTPCAVCGRRGYDEWAASDEEWQKYVPLKYRDKDICRVCFERFKKGGSSNPELKSEDMDRLQHFVTVADMRRPKTCKVEEDLAIYKKSLKIKDCGCSHPHVECLHNRFSESRSGKLVLKCCSKFLPPLKRVGFLWRFLGELLPNPGLYVL